MKLSDIHWLVLAIMWRVIVALIIATTIISYPFTPTYANPEMLSHYGPRWLTSLAQFDGIHYLTIVEKGYVGTGLIQAFFPLYPLLIKMFSLGLINPVWVGMLISLFCFICGSFLLIKLILIDYHKDIAYKTLLLMLLFPTAFFFGAVYNEGFFFFLTVAVFYLSRKHHWWLAGIVGALAAATRFVGVFLVFALVYEYYIYSKENRGKSFFIYTATLLPIVGLFSFMIYLQLTFGDPLLFFHVQNAFGANRESSGLVIPLQVFYRYIKIFFNLQADKHLIFIVVQEFISALGGIILGVVGWYKIRRSYILYALPALITPMLTGTFSSLPRYILPLFPYFLVLVLTCKRQVFWVLALIFAILQVVNLIFFTQGLWVA